MLEIVQGLPHPALRPLLADGYWGWAEHGAPSRRVEVPQSGVVLVLSLGPSLEVDGERRTSFVAGLYDVPVLLTHDGEQLGIQANLTPLGARVLLRLPLREITRTTVDVGEVLGREGREVEERLAGLPDWPARFSALDAFLLGRLRDADAPRADVAYAWRRLADTGGEARVGALCRELRCSRRHLATRVGEELGLPPKTLARLLRFERAVAALRADVPAAAVAAACGYADQPHLTREFRALAGVTPRGYQLAVQALGEGRAIAAQDAGKRSQNDKTGATATRTVAS